MKGYKFNLKDYYPTKPTRKPNTGGLSLAGTRAATFNGSNLATGSYLCVMTTKDDNKTVEIVKN
jgi:hypothetical protein